MDFSKYIGVPYKEMDCYVIVKKFYKEYFGVDLLRFYEGNTPTPEDVQTLVFANKCKFEKVELSEAKLGDIIIIEMFGLECHLGIFINKGYMIHTMERTGSVMDKIDRYKNKIRGVYRATPESFE